MQTFLPYPSFSRTARTLDRARLGQQRREALLAVRCLAGRYRRGVWSNHPVCRMWRGHEHALLEYALTICNEWTRRGYRDSIAGKLRRFEQRFAEDTGAPPWLGQRTFHDSHKSALLAKDLDFYRRFRWNVPVGGPYVWPV